MNVEEILRRRSRYVLRKIERRHGPGELLFVAVVCDNCKRSVQAPSAEQLVLKLDGWYIDDQLPGREIDYCPDCVARVM